jgi:ATP/maltotriose-dependent transcriptional regulator MalT
MATGVAASGRDVLLATKLYVPREQPGFVPRPRLAEALDEGLAGGLVLVCAPAGCGKTVLLADCARRGRWPVAWLSLDAADNDPPRFWGHVIAALDRARPGIGERVGPLLGPPAPNSFEGLVTSLINELDARPGQDEVLLVLDDYHLIGARQVHAPLEFLVEHLPPACTWCWPAGPTLLWPATILRIGHRIFWRLQKGTSHEHRLHC